MKKFLLGAVLALTVLFGAQTVMASALINGAGATFPYPIYAKWAYAYNKATGVKINYQSIGSGGGVRQAVEGTVDFGASDAPMAPEELAKAGLLQFPMVMGGVVPVVNIKGVKAGELKLTPELLADIYLKKITKWNDERITALNPGVALPAKRITVVRRSDGSGTTWIFTNYLAKVSAEWKSKVGFGKAVSWPTGVGGKGNEGVATYVKRIKNSIGYVEFAYALQNRLVHTRLKNRAGNFVEPNMEGFSAAAAGADWKGTPGFAVVLTDTAGKEAWPIAGATFILIHKEAKNCSNAKAVLDFFDWAYKNGADMALSLDYVPMPKEVYTLMEKTWAETIKCSGAPVWK
ncbi:MAG: phosphate ABC transporter substrate-binding protein PstS [Proteobacteria bacterium]|nr:phosphate ABC transporter substrate-binding protein PstS [Pseudomonadota bacterium]